MKSKICFFAILSAFVICMEACNSTPYEIVEIEDEPDTVKTATNYSEIKKELEEPKQEIKEDIGTNSTKENITESREKFNDTKEQYSANFAIQIGAFASEQNADRFTSRANRNTQYDFYNQLNDGLYKVRFGNFSSKSDARAELDKLKEAGYWDSFVVEIKK